jgi:hypothetical protein
MLRPPQGWAWFWKQVGVHMISSFIGALIGLYVAMLFGYHVSSSREPTPDPEYAPPNRRLILQVKTVPFKESHDLRSDK